MDVSSNAFYTVLFNISFLQQHCHHQDNNAVMFSVSPFVTMKMTMMTMGMTTTTAM